jgi:hypothetical protein
MHLLAGDVGRRLHAPQREKFSDVDSSLDSVLNELAHWRNSWMGGDSDEHTASRLIARYDTLWISCVDKRKAVEVA